MLKKEKRKEIGKSMCMCVCLSAGSSPVMPLPWLVARSCLRVITRVGTPSKPVDLPRILGHLQLKVPNKPDKLLVLHHNGLDWKKGQC